MADDFSNFPRPLNTPEAQHSELMRMMQRFGGWRAPTTVPSAAPQQSAMTGIASLVGQDRPRHSASLFPYPNQPGEFPQPEQMHDAFYYSHQPNFGSSPLLEALAGGLARK